MDRNLSICIITQDQVHQFAIVFNMLYRKMLFNVVQLSASHCTDKKHLFLKDLY